MQITRNNLETNAGPSEWFTGAVYLDPIASPSGSSRAHAVRVHFAPGARTAWHTHPHGQTIYILEGVAHAQRRLTASCAIWQSSTSTTRASPQPGVNTSPTRSTAPADTRD